MKMDLLTAAQKNKSNPFQQMQAANFAMPNGCSPPAIANEQNLAQLSQHYLRFLMLNELYRQQNMNAGNGEQQRLPQQSPPENSTLTNPLAAAALFARC